MATAALNPALRSVAPRRVPAHDVKVAIWPVLLVIYATLLPREIRFDLSGLTFYVDRVALMLTVPWMIYKINQGVIRFVLPDWLILLAGAWLIIAMAQVYGIGRAFSSGGAIAFDSIAGYYLARISFRSLTDIRRALIIAAPGFLISGLSVMAESISHQLFVRPAFIPIFGPINYTRGGVDVVIDTLRNENRWGLLRGYGPWPHPILAGLHLATLLPVYWLSGVRGWPRWAGIIASMTAFFTVSSAALLSLAIAVLFVSYDWLSVRVKELSWARFIIGGLFAMMLAQIFSRSGIINLITRYATVDSSTAYFRQAIWEYGLRSVQAHPWFGIGLESYERASWMLTTSVDNYWLLWAMRYGLPAAVMLFTACIVALIALGASAARAPRVDARFFRGIAMSLSLLLLMGWTVALQGGTLTWFTLLLGGCVACAQQAYRTPRITLTR